MSKHRGRRVPSADALRRGQVATVEATDEAAWREIEDSRTLDRHVIAAGVAQNRESGEFHTWVSLYGTDVTSWYVGRDQATASAILLAIRKLFEHWTGTKDDRESMDALLDVARERSTNPRATLPDDQVREIGIQIAELERRKS